MTKTLTVNSAAPELAIIQIASSLILKGGIVAFPTETVYGLGANVYDPAAVSRIFVAKGRPAEDPLIVHLSSVTDLERAAVDIPGIVNILAARFWPGPLTLVLKKHPRIHPAVSAGLDTVAVRVPAHPVALALLKTSGVPIVAPSANMFGHSSPTTAQHVVDDLSGRIDLVLDAGPTQVGVESTVLDVTAGVPTILRPGGVTLEALQETIGAVNLRSSSSSPADGPQISPGLLEKHYAPHAELLFFQITDWHSLIASMQKNLEQCVEEGKKVGLLIADEDLSFFVNTPALSLSAGSTDDPVEIARNLYSCIRKLDEAHVDVILARDFGEQGIGRAIRDRLRRASSRVIHHS